MSQHAPCACEVCLAAHDSRNVLAAMVGLAHLGGVGASVRIGRCIRAIDGILGSLLPGGRWVAGPPDKPAKALSFQEWIEDLEKWLVGFLSSPRQKLVLSSDAQKVPLYADLLSLERSLGNLVRNASRAMVDSNDGCIHIHLGQDNKGNLLLSVLDNGPGMSGRNPPDQGGLGLRSVRECTKKSNGQMWVSSQPGRTRVNLRVPNQAPFILVAEDNRLLGHLIESALRDEGYRTACVRSAQEFEAFIASDSHPVSLYLVDAGLGIPYQDLGSVVIMSGTDWTGTVNERTGERMHTLVKPFSMGSLLAAVRQSLGDSPMDSTKDLKAGVNRGRVLVVESVYYEEVALLLREGASRALEQEGITFDIISVPGALEVPTAIAMAERTNRYDGYVALGCVVRGETLHFEIVANESARQLSQLAVSLALPVGNGILTTFDRRQALDRANPAKKDAGGRAARACVAMVRLKEGWGGG